MSSSELFGVVSPDSLENVPSTLAQKKEVIKEMTKVLDNASFRLGDVSHVAVETISILAQLSGLLFQKQFSTGAAKVFSSQQAAQNDTDAVSGTLAVLQVALKTVYERGGKFAISPGIYTSDMSKLSNGFKKLCAGEFATQEMLNEQLALLEQAEGQVEFQG